MSSPQLPFSVAQILPPAFRGWAEPLAPALGMLLIPHGLLNSLENARQSGTGARMASHLLDALDIRFIVDDSDLARIPAEGASILVANHPYGIVEGLILMVMLDRVRQDYKIIANSWLGAIPELREQTILVNPFETRAAHSENRAPLRETLEWLKSGGLLSVFPAGEVAHLDWKQQSVTDPEWKTSAARLALKTRCAVVPAFFEGANSFPFQMAGMVHPGLRTMALGHEFGRMRGRTVRLHIGSPIPLPHWPDAPTLHKPRFTCGPGPFFSQTVRSPRSLPRALCRASGRASHRKKSGCSRRRLPLSPWNVNW